MATIGSSLFSKIGAGLSFSNGSRQAKEKNVTSSVENSLKEEEGGATIDVRSPSLSNASQAVDVAGALATASKAVDSIQSVREEQLNLARQAKETSSQILRDEISTAIDDLEDEVSRITSNATYNGNAVLTSGFASTFEGENGQSESIVTGSASSITNDLQLNVSSVSDATAAVATLESALGAVHSFSSGLEAASNKADNIIERIAAPQVEAEANAADKLTTIEEAEDLAAYVASEIRSAASGSSPELLKKEIVDTVTKSLSPERVANLLE